MPEPTSALRHHLRSSFRRRFPVPDSPWIYFVLAAIAGIAAGHLVVEASNPLMVPVLFVGAIAALIVVQNLDFCMVLFVFFTFARLPGVLSAHHGIRGTKQALLAFLVVALLIHWFVRGHRIRPWKRPAFFIGAYVMAWVMSFIPATDIEVARTTFDESIRAAITGSFMIFLMRGYLAARRVLWTFIAIAILLGTLNCYQELTGTFGNTYWGLAYAQSSVLENDRETFRICGVFKDPNYFGMALVVLVPMCLDRLWSEKLWYRRALAGWGLTVCVMAIVFTESRGAFLGLVVVAGMMMVLRPPKPATLIISATVVILSLPLLPREYTERLLTIGNVFSVGGEEGTQEKSLKGRTSEMRVAVQMFLDHPVLGAGIGNYNVLYEFYAADIGLDAREGRSAHSLYLEIAAETGLVGLGAFFLMIGAMAAGLRDGYRSLKARGLKDEAQMTAAFGAGLAGFLTCSTFLHGAYPVYLWILVGISFGLKNIADDVPVSERAYIR